MTIAVKLAATASAAAIVLALQVPRGTAPMAAAAGEPVAFTIPAEDGYGIADCMTTASACGQQIADAWCVEHGRTRAVAFGAADVTGDIPREAAPLPPPGAVVIRCN